MEDNMQNPIPIPSEGFIRLPQVLTIFPFSRTSLWRRIKAGKFPKPYKLGPSTNVWDVQELREWRQRLTEERDEEYDNGNC